MDDLTRIAKQRSSPAIVRLWQALAPLKSVASFMNTGAHPDDETTAMLAAFALGEGMRVSIACATRGEGGQNSLGTERGADLGAVRTREMEEAARELDMTVHWLSTGPDDPIVDFGFSKSADETLAKWGRERTLERLTRIIRRDRPDIVCATFLDVPGQHGHHRAMTQAAREAVRLAADGKAFPGHSDEGLSPWQVAKFYLPAWSGAGRSYDDAEPPPNATVVVETGDTDPVLGATYAQIGEWSRASHRTQGMGRWVEPGPMPVPLHLAFSATGPESESSAADGLPKNLADLAQVAERRGTSDALCAASEAIAATLAAWPDGKAVARQAAAALSLVRKARAELGPEAAAAFGHRLLRKEAELARVMAVAAGLEISFAAVPAVASPGCAVAVAARYNDPFGRLDALELDLAVPHAWQITRTADGFRLVVPDDAHPSDPCPARFDPLESAEPVCGVARFSLSGVAAEIRIPFEERLWIVPAASVHLAPPHTLVNRARKPRTIGVGVTLGTHSRAASPVDVAVVQPTGWQVRFEDGRTHTFHAAGPGTHTAEVIPPTAPADGVVTLPVTIDGRPAPTLTRAYSDHIGQVFRAAPAAFRILTLKAEFLDGVKTAYVGGGHDSVDRSLRQLGIPIEPLGPDRLPHVDLDDYDTLVVGIFAFGARPDLRARVSDLHAFVREGGNLVTLYHRPWDGWDAATTPPRLLEIGQPSLRYRVTDENAAVDVLLPGHHLVRWPNRIGPDDWSGWVKERGLYFAARWDSAYEPLLSMADPGEAPLTGALITARIGAGIHTHCSLVLHYQMEELVPGAFRLMANLISAGKAPVA